MTRENMRFSDNRKISVRQIRRTLTLEMLGVSSLLLPGYLAGGSGSDGVFAMALGAAGAWLLVLVWERLTKKRDFFEALKRCGAPVRLAVSLFYGGALLGLAGYMLYLLTRLVIDQLLEAKFEPMILLTLGAAAVFALLKGIESRVRVYEVLFWFLLIPLLIILGLACASVNPEYWPPAAASAPSVFAENVYVSFLFFSLSSLFLFFRRTCNHPQRAVCGVKAGIVWVLLLNAGIYMILMGIFQTGLLAQLEYPVITLMAVVKLPGEFFERQDAFMMAIWFFCLFALLNALLFYGKILLQNGAGVFGGQPAEGRFKRNGFWACGCGLAVLVLAVVLLHTNISAERFLTAYVRAVCPLMLSLPLLIFAAGARKGGCS